MKRILNYFLFLSFFILLFAATATTSTDFSQDLGRHLKLGEIIVKTGRVPTINLFSFTNPQFPFINHHWLSEVIFYIVYQVIHPNALLILKILLVLSAFYVTVKTAVKKSNMLMAIISACIFFPLFLDRNDLRPELFGYMFYEVFLYFFITVKKINKYLLIIPVLLLFWVNMHISFAFGIMISLLIIVKFFIKLLNQKKSDRHCERSEAIPALSAGWPSGLFTMTSKQKDFVKLLLFILSFFVVFINPNGILGALYPLKIFGNYGYPIVENQNLFFLAERISNPLITYFFIISPIVIITILFLFLRKKILEGILLLLMFTAAIFQIRHFPFFVLTVIPFTAWMIYYLFLFIKRRVLIQINIDKYHYISILLVSFIIFFSSFFFFDNSYFNTFDSNKRFGFGYEESEKEATDFILSRNLKGNIFNNFDIGGYLIYRLYPNYKTFIDNRPEAYPSDFIQKIYIPMQEDQDMQDRIFNKYKVHTIVFSHTDQTPWAQQLIVRISKAKNWKLVFLNSKIIIFTQNTNLIDLRNKDLFIKTQIENENNYLNLIRYYGILKIIYKEDLANAAFDKAKLFGTDSCILKRNTAAQMQNSIYFSQADDYKRSSFWCF